MNFHFNKNWRLIILLTASMIILSTLPYLFLYLTTPAGLTYPWIFSFNPRDTLVYFSYLEQVNRGHFFFTDLFTSEPHIPFLNIFWLTAGLLGKTLNLAIPVTFHFIRIILILPLIWTLSKTIDFFIPNYRNKKIVLVALTFLTGFGVILSIFFKKQIVPEIGAGMDLVSPEATPYLSMFYSGHFILSWILLLWSVILTWKTFKEKRVIVAFLSGLIGLFLFQFHPYYAPFIFLFSLTSAFFYYLKNKDSLLKIIGLFLLQTILYSPSLFYYFYLFLSDYRSQIFFRQNFTPSPPGLVTLFSFGLLGPITIFGLIKIFKEKKIAEETWALILWLTIGGFLLYLPLNSQRRFIEGLLVPVLFLSLPTIEQIFGAVKSSFPEKIAHFSIIGLLILFSSQTTFFVFYLNKSVQKERPEIVYYDTALKSAAEWLKENSSEDDLIIGSDSNLIFLAALSGRRVYAGHYGETLFSDIKKQNITSFFQNTDVLKKIKFLKDNKITLLYWSKKEKDLAPNFNPKNETYLTKIYSQDESEIYKVVNK